MNNGYKYEWGHNVATYLGAMHAWNWLLVGQTELMGRCHRVKHQATQHNIGYWDNIGGHLIWPDLHKAYRLSGEGHCKYKKSFAQVSGMTAGFAPRIKLFSLCMHWKFCPTSQNQKKKLKILKMAEKFNFWNCHKKSVRHSTNIQYFEL